MALNGKKRDLLSSRRRVEDEGEDDDGVEDLADDSQSEASILTVDEPGAAEESDVSEISRSEAALPPNSNESAQGTKANDAVEQETPSTAPVANGAKPNGGAVFSQTADVEAMVNGLKISDDAADSEVLEFDDTAEVVDQAATAEAIPQTGSGLGQHGTSAARNQRLEKRPNALKQANPHTEGQRAGHYGQHAQNGQVAVNAGAPMQNQLNGRGTGRGRPQGVAQNSFQQHNLPPHVPGSNARWSHDLHDSVQAAPQPQPSRQGPPPPGPPSVSTASKPNPSRSITLGNVAARIYLSQMEQPRVLDKKITVRQHTHLPDLRPPLRRDKAVRVSIPGHEPRFQFPSLERSFVFIPRAQRPNQQAKLRRGYGSRSGSRRTSVQGSAYSPSVAMSRRSSFIGNGMMPSNGSMMGRSMVGAPTGPSRPIVRLPPGQSMPFQTFPGSMEASYPLPSEPVRREHRSSQMTMHQPRPQKQMSVASIEGEQQAFHQQLPPEARRQSIQSQALSHSHSHSQSHIGTPLHYIPESAINAPAFQPSAGPQQPYYYPMQPQPMYYYPPPDAQPPAYGYPPPIDSPYMQQNPYYMPMPMMMGDGNPNTYMQEQNGMFYYYDSAQMEQGEQQQPPMMTPNAEAFYPQQQQPPQSGGYYDPQGGPS